MNAPLLINTDCVFSADHVYRYRLKRVWDTSRPIAVFVLLNPSTADEWIDDNTIRKCLGFARRWGCGGIEVVNIFAYRETDPELMKLAPDPIGADNDQHILDACRGARIVVAGWGKHGAHRDRGRAVARLLEANHVMLRCFRHNQDGTPMHPLYVSYEAQLTPYLADHPRGARGL